MAPGGRDAVAGGRDTRGERADPRTAAPSKHRRLAQPAETPTPVFVTAMGAQQLGGFADKFLPDRLVTVRPRGMGCVVLVSASRRDVGGGRE